MSITNNTKMTNAQFQKHLQQYDINKDGKIDESDAKALDALAKKQAAQSQDNSFEPGTQNALQRQSNSNKKKANALRQMLKKDNNGTIDKNDVLDPKHKPKLEKYKGTDATQTVQTDITNLGREIKSKWDEYRDPNTSKERKEQLRTEIQELTQEKSQLMQFLTNMLRMQHENAMAAIRNIR